MTNNALKIFSSAETLQQFKTNALEQAKRFDISMIVPQYEALYNRFL